MTPPGDLLAPAAWAVLTGLTNLPIVGATKPGQPPAQPGQARVVQPVDLSTNLCGVFTIKNLLGHFAKQVFKHCKCRCEIWTLVYKDHTR